MAGPVPFSLGGAEKMMELRGHGRAKERAGGGTRHHAGIPYLAISARSHYAPRRPPPAGQTCDPRPPGGNRYHPSACPYPRPEKLSILAQPPSRGVRVVLILVALAAGLAVTARFGVSPPAVTQRCDTIAMRARACQGDSVLADAQMQPRSSSRPLFSHE